MRRVSEIGEIPEVKQEKVKRFTSLIQKLQKTPSNREASSVIKEVLDITGYKKFLDDGSLEGEARLENVKELISVASKYDRLEPGMSLQIFLEEISLITDLDEINEKENAVSLMTLHSAKGLEFPWVFISGLEDGLLPHSRSMLSEAELEEERRLFYVGITRAKDRLFLLRAKNRLLYGEYQTSIPSQFLFDIPEHLLLKGDEEEYRPFSRIIDAKPIPYESPFRKGPSVGTEDSRSHEKPRSKNVKQDFILFHVGDRVRHRKWGEGIVMNLAGSIIVVAFEDPRIGVKKLAIAIAPLEKIG